MIRTENKKAGTVCRNWNVNAMWVPFATMHHSQTHIIANNPIAHYFVQYNIFLRKSIIFYVYSFWTILQIIFIFRSFFHFYSFIFTLFLSFSRVLFECIYCMHYEWQLLSDTSFQKRLYCFFDFLLFLQTPNEQINTIATTEYRMHFILFLSVLIVYSFDWMILKVFHFPFAPDMIEMVSVTWHM